MQEITDIEAQLAAAGIGVDRLCEAARIDRSTWTRWKQGRVVPRLDNWQRTNAAYRSLIGDTPCSKPSQPDSRS